MKKKLLLVLIICQLLPLMINAGSEFDQPEGKIIKNLLNAPEALTFDEKSERFFVANYNGTIIRIEKDGQQNLLVKGQGSCSGIHLLNKVLYSNCGPRRTILKGFNSETGQEVFNLPIREAQYLNDIVSDDEGKFLYVSDFNRYQGKIFKVNIAQKSYTVFLDKLYRLTCGMIYEKENNRLMFMSGSGEKSLIQAVNLKDKSISDLYTSTEFAGFDCLNRDEKGFYYVSSWRKNAIYQFDNNFTKPEIVFTDGIRGPAGFEYITGLNKLAIPSFTDNYIDFIPLPSEYKTENLNTNELLYNSMLKEGIKGVDKKLKDLKTKYGKFYNFDEKVLIRLANNLIGQRKFSEFIKVKKYSFKKYPQKAKVKDQLEVAVLAEDQDELNRLQKILQSQLKSKELSENLLNQLGYDLLQISKPGAALKIFKLNVELFPNSANVHDSYAEACFINGKKNLAIISYKKVLTLDPKSRNAQEQLVRLSGDEKMIDAGKYKLNTIVYGKGTGPSVVLINGMNRDQKYWSSIIPKISTFTTIFCYDPVNIGSSDRGIYPQAGGEAVEDLKILLEKRNIPKPYILVAHSFAGMYARLFAGTHPKDVGGLVLIDSTPVGLIEALANVLKGEEKKGFLKFANMRPAAMKATEELVKKVKLPPIPLIVLSAGRYDSLTRYAPETRERTREVTGKLSKKMAQLIPGGKQIVVKDVGHGIHVEKPQVVIEAIKEVFNKVKDKK